MIPQPDDFYVEKGKFVWTEKFLLNRGYCCNNNCRHCPYKGQPKPDQELAQKELVETPKFWRLSTK